MRLTGKSMTQSETSRPSRRVRTKATRRFLRQRTRWNKVLTPVMPIHRSGELLITLRMPVSPLSIRNKIPNSPISKPVPMRQIRMWTLRGGATCSTQSHRCTSAWSEREWGRHQVSSALSTTSSTETLIGPRRFFWWSLREQSSPRLRFTNGAGTKRGRSSESRRPRRWGSSRTSSTRKMLNVLNSSRCRRSASKLIELP